MVWDGGKGPSPVRIWQTFDGITWNEVAGEHRLPDLIKVASDGNGNFVAIAANWTYRTETQVEGFPFHPLNHAGTLMHSNDGIHWTHIEQEALLR